MAQGDTPITVVGNLVADPELRFTANGAAVANFRVASTPRTFNRDSGQWEDGEALFLSCSVWRSTAENVAESLKKGMRVIVNGRLKQRSYNNREGESRTVFEVEVDEVGPSLKYATANVNRVARDNNSGGYNNQNSGGGNYNQGGQGNQPSNQGGFGQGGQNQPSNQGGFGNMSYQGGNDQNQQNQRQQSQQNQPVDNDPWNSAPQVGGFDGSDDEPPF
ncbi:single-stranded DNA-binding protein [Corynebacterium aquatimens]|uniref:Single-stranded DNA-binding protein n=1 Tax=Corynebacterium aquatimens TaxID=1190508 RepID=A0A931E447_9CORY|nr:single-stranded DNA-binding protein [Corynebacterium aquatimens]MBG6122786.1 single-strand DNA-binding protein [Corynebacterium aquatimens]WJY66879.1 Single-stranded DNA-binding protein [Corynebacterium aquatimens]